ncbi:uncharacterized protein LOC126906318 [Daktulosphaira vitifoliae]|uniref:uncharacterized protein LOC126906318 n=1 Tax=Daktulosphaira vitifoliae TaxID=58002 RepID=UPI0021AAB6DE|nr:uncharacterized protein LOC126906318 [Daktulosphaira vitifoliae]
MLFIIFLSSTIGFQLVKGNDPYETYHNQSQLMDATISNMFSCLTELNINPDVCKDMLKKGADPTDKKFDSCKCIGPCVGQKMGTMNKKTGHWNITRFIELEKLIDNEVLMKEAKLIETHCQDDVNTFCDAGFVLANCILEHSAMAKEMLQNYMDSNDSGDQKEENR